MVSPYLLSDVGPWQSTSLRQNILEDIGNEDKAMLTLTEKIDGRVWTTGQKPTVTMHYTLDETPDDLTTKTRRAGKHAAARRRVIV